MAEGFIRRHSVLLSDREVVMLDRAIRAYAAVLGIQTGGNPRTEGDDTARVSTVVQTHMRSCHCPPPVERS